MASFIAGCIVGVLATMAVLCVCGVIHDENIKEDHDDE